jgi:hypothetical protein
MSIGEIRSEAAVRDGTVRQHSGLIAKKANDFGSHVGE